MSKGCSSGAAARYGKLTPRSSSLSCGRELAGWRARRQAIILLLKRGVLQRPILNVPGPRKRAANESEDSVSSRNLTSLPMKENSGWPASALLQKANWLAIERDRCSMPMGRGARGLAIASWIAGRVRPVQDRIPFVVGGMPAKGCRIPCRWAFPAHPCPVTGLSKSSRKYRLIAM